MTKIPWIKLGTALVEYCHIQQLPSREFRRKFLACINGEENEFSQFVKPDPCNGRVFSRQWREIRTRIFLRDDFTCR